jgi:hypothetical protein
MSWGVLFLVFVGVLVVCFVVNAICDWFDNKTGLFLGFLVSTLVSGCLIAGFKQAAVNSETPSTPMYTPACHYSFQTGTCEP